jgi:hypothetical protein
MRCSTTSWWRRIRISAILRAGRTPVVRVIRRKKNRRHMIGDHYGPTPGRATVLVRAVDAILGTHRVKSPPGSSFP